MATAVEEFKQRQYRVLVGLGHPDNVEGLMSIASVFARRQQGRIIALSVLLTPAGAADPDEQAVANAEAVVAQAENFGAELGIAVDPVVEPAPDVPAGIMQFLAHTGADLILLGFSPPAIPDPSADQAPGRITEALAGLVGCSLAIVAFPRDPDDDLRLLVPITPLSDPSVGHDLARIAAIFGGASVTFLGMLPGNLSEEEFAASTASLRKSVADLDLGETEEIHLACEDAAHCLFGAEVQQMGGDASRAVFMIRATL